MAAGPLEDDSGSQAELTCIAINGATPYSYDWERVSGVGLITAGDLTATVTVFRGPAGGEGVFRCKVTDNQSNITYTNNVTVTFPPTGAPP